MATPNQLEIVNTALSMIGHSPLVSLDTQSGVAARLQYNAAVRHFLSENEWRFALRQVNLSGQGVATSSTSMAQDYTYEYTLPDDCIRALGFSNSGSFEIYGNKIFTEMEIQLNDEIYFIYIKEVTSEWFPAYFTGALVYRLASLYARSIARSTTEADSLEALFRRESAIAKHRDAQTSYNTGLERAVDRLLARPSSSRP
jgi:hypothetical protein